MNVTLTPEGYTHDGKWRLVPVEPTAQMYDTADTAYAHGDDPVREAIKAAPNPPQSLLSEWQPISTAKKDSKPILVLRPSGVMIVVWWSAGGWKSGGRIGHLALTPHTKWMPLPEPAP